MGFLSSLTGGDIGKATMNALGQNKGLIKGFQTTGNDLINSGEQKQRDALFAGIGNYDTFLSNGKAANSLYGDALGLNGADGNARATGAFQAGPGYDFAMDQGTNAALRGASAAGMLNSGNTLTALTNFGQGLANQEYGSWLDRLKGQSDTGLQAASGEMAGYGGVANAAGGATDNRLGLEGNVLQGLIGNNNQTAQVKEQQAANKGSFLSSLISGGLSLGTKALTGGLF